MSDQSQALHETIERRLLAPYQVALLLDNGALALMDSRAGAQITLDSDAAYNLLDLLSAHKTLLQQISQGQDQPTAPPLHLAQDESGEAMSNATIEFDLPRKEEQPGP